jgi:hypothetical protein
MKYETPELTALTPAISAIQLTLPSKAAIDTEDNGEKCFAVPSYQDWE